MNNKMNDKSKSGLNQMNMFFKREEISERN